MFNLNGRPAQIGIYFSWPDAINAWSSATVTTRELPATDVFSALPDGRRRANTARVIGPAIPSASRVVGLFDVAIKKRWSSRIFCEVTVVSSLKFCWLRPCAWAKVAGKPQISNPKAQILGNKTRCCLTRVSQRFEIVVY